MKPCGTGWDELMFTGNHILPFHLCIPFEFPAYTLRVTVHARYQMGSGNRTGLRLATTGWDLWNSEFGDGDETGIKMAACLNKDLFELKNTGWVYWQVTDCQQHHYHWCSCCCCWYIPIILSLLSADSRLLTKQEDGACCDSTLLTILLILTLIQNFSCSHSTVATFGREW